MCASSCTRIASACAGSQPGQRADRKQDDGTPPADDARDVDGVSFHDAHELPHANERRQMLGPRLPERRRCRERRAMQPSHAPPAAEQRAAAEERRRRATARRSSATRRRAPVAWTEFESPFAPPPRAGPHRMRTPARPMPQPSKADRRRRAPRKRAAGPSRPERRASPPSRRWRSRTGHEARPRAGAGTRRPRRRRSHFPARRNEEASSRRRQSSEPSAPPMFFDELADFLQLIR